MNDFKLASITGILSSFCLKRFCKPLYHVGEITVNNEMGFSDTCMGHAYNKCPMYACNLNSIKSVIFF